MNAQIGNSRHSAELNPFVSVIYGLLYTVMILVMSVVAAFQRLVLITRFDFACAGLSNDQHDALWSLTDLDLSHRQNDFFFIDPYEDDRVTLDPHEVQMLERCRNTEVPFELIQKFAPNYAYNTIIPRPS